MKKIMLGNEALARGLYEAGVKFVSSYPGTPSTEITEYASKYSEIYCEWAPNEKVALESAFGAALSGIRSFCAMKHVGLNVAADPLFTLSYTGINAGLVLCVADDPGMHSSQNEQDTRYYGQATNIPVLEPSDSSEALNFVPIAYELSEKYDTPVIIKTCTRIAHCRSIVELGNRIKIADREYKKDISKFVMMPNMAKKRHPFVIKRTKNLQDWAETSNINFEDEAKDNSIGIITHSTSYQYVKEVCSDRYPILKLGMTFPLPVKKIKDFATKVNKLYVIEELSGYLEAWCKQNGCNCVGKKNFSELYELSQHQVADGLDISHEFGVKFSEDVPTRPPILCPGCPHRGIYYLLNKMHVTVLGDIGCYTLGAMMPWDSVDTTLCMGASISSIHGFNKLNNENSKKTIGIIGDSTFMHSGMTGLANIVYNQSNSTLIILDNSITGMTGHQQNPTTGLNIYDEPAGKVCLEDLCKSMGINRVRIIDPYDLNNCEKIINEELKADEASVIISRRPCALLKEVKFPGPIEYDKDKCIQCMRCMKLGCSAISFINNKISIDKTLCVGCGVCAQLCNKNVMTPHPNFNIKREVK